MRLPSISELKWLVVIVSVVVIAIGSLSWMAQSRIDAQTREHVGQVLEHIRYTRASRMLDWARTWEARATRLAGRPEVGQLTGQLAAVAGDRAELLESPAQIVLYSLLESEVFESYLVLDRQNRVLSAEFEEPIGKELVPTTEQGFMERIWAGETVLSAPELAPKEWRGSDATIQEGLPTVLIGVPVFAVDGSVQSAVLLRIDPVHSLPDFLTQDRTTGSGDTYLYDTEGRRISPYPAQGSGRALPAAETAANGGINISGYRDARGVQVVGAWTWLPGLNFGIATEMDAENMYAGTSLTHTVIQLLTGTVILLVLTLGVLFARVMRRNEVNRRKLLDRTAVDKLITSLSTRFISLPIEQIDSGIQEALADFCRFSGVGAIRVGYFCDHGERVDVTHVHVEADMCDIGEHPTPQSQPWWFGKVSSGQPVVVNKISHLPPSGAQLREHFESTGVQSALDVPLVWQDKVVGFMSFLGAKPRRWNEGDLQLMTLASQMVGSVIQRQRLARELETAQTDLERRVELRTAELAYSEEKTRRSEMRLRSVTENLPAAVVQTRSEDGVVGRFEYVSKGVEAIFGVDADTVMNDPGSLWGSIHKEDKEWLIQRIVVAVSREEASVNEYRVQDKDGTTRWVRSAFSPTPQDNGSILWTGYSMDITDRRIAEEKNRETELKLRNVTDNIPGAVYQSRTRPDGSKQFEFISRGIEDIFGIDADTAKADYQRVVACIREDDLAGLNGRLNDAIENHRPYEAEYRIATADGSEKWVRSSAVPLRQENGDTLWFGCWSNVTAQKRLERDLQKAREVAEEAAAARSAFLANMSHEVRTPMNGVMGMLELLLDTSLTAEQRDSIEVARSSAESLLVILNDILDLSKIEAGQLEMETIPFHVGKEINSAVRVLSANAVKRGNSLKLDLQLGRHQLVVGDPGRLRQVITNLVSNAVKFTEGGDIVVSVEADTVVDGVLSTRFAVRDTGIGIPEDRQQAIFEEFTQADASVTRVHGGTGLGLSICTNLVSRMGGELRLNSREGEGSEFWFVLPLPLAHVDQDRAGSEGSVGQPQPSELSGDTSQPEATSLSILLAEDNMVNQRIAAAMLSKRGHRVDLASNGQIAVDKVRAQRYDIILMDIQMPEMDGLSATRAIRDMEGRRDIPIVALTAHAFAEERERCEDAGMDGFLGKPFKGPELIALTERLASSGFAAESSVQTTEAA